MQERVKSELPLVHRRSSEWVAKEDWEHNNQGQFSKDQSYQAKDPDGASFAIIRRQQEVTRNLQEGVSAKGWEEVDLWE